jgi:4'-phosphopantetheinyl transferase
MGDELVIGGQRTAWPVLEGLEAHIWRAPLDLDRRQLRELQDTLSGEELAKAMAFRFEWDRGRFVAARGWLRWVLGRYLDRAPQDLRFRSDSGGKPALAGPGDGIVRFNVSHSGGLALVAVAAGREIGVDVERISAGFPGLEVAERFFARAEVDRLASLPAELQTRAFFACWTRKEAYVKARGIGQALPLDQFEVSLGPDEPATLRSWGADEAELTRWSLHVVDVGAEHTAAVVLEGPEARVRCLDCNPRWLGAAPAPD